MKIKKDLILRKIEKEFFILDTEKEKLHNLNETASLILDFHLKKLPEEHIAKNIEKKFDISYEDALKDVKSILEEFKKRGIIE